MFLLCRHTPKHLDDYITDYGGFTANIVSYSTSMAQYGASLLANVHKHLQLTQCLLMQTALTPVKKLN